MSEPEFPFPELVAFMDELELEYTAALRRRVAQRQAVYGRIWAQALRFAVEIERGEPRA